MPRRREPDPLAEAVGRRIRQLREEAGLTLEKLAYESDLGSKGYLSDIEKGLARPTIKTLKVIADHLGLLLLDLVTFPDDDERQKLIDLTRDVPEKSLTSMCREAQSLRPTRQSKEAPGRPLRRGSLRHQSRT